MKSEENPANAEAQLATIYAALGTADVLKREDVPEDVRKAATLLASFAEKELSAPEPEPSLIQKMKAVFKARNSQPTPTQPDDDADDVEPKGPAKPVNKDKTAMPNSTDDVQDTQEAQDVAKAETEPAKSATEPILKELKKLRKAAEAEREELRGDLDVIKSALGAALDRISELENGSVGSYQVSGQEYAEVNKAADSNSLRAGIMRAFQGDRITLS